jgi:hypothetical protein
MSEPGFIGFVRKYFVVWNLINSESYQKKYDKAFIFS